MENARLLASQPAKRPVQLEIKAVKITNSEIRQRLIPLPIHGIRNLMTESDESDSQNRVKKVTTLLS